MVSATRDPVKARAGTIGARARWGPARVLRLDQLDPVTAGIIRAILDAQASAAQREAAGASASPTALTEVRRGSVDSLQS